MALADSDVRDEDEAMEGLLGPLENNGDNSLSLAFDITAVCIVRYWPSC